MVYLDTWQNASAMGRQVTKVTKRPDTGADRAKAMLIVLAFCLWFWAVLAYAISTFLT